jgi:hypothetical protein
MLNMFIQINEYMKFITCELIIIFLTMIIKSKSSLELRFQNYHQVIDIFYEKMEDKFSDITDTGYKSRIQQNNKIDCKKKEKR